jgi:2-polyprenyl-3-methyl-5-hydroxy-6-metoxy-1,4-benzoquinol methylase
MIASDAFLTVDACWICGGRAFTGLHEASFDLSEYRRQDPELAAYSGSRVAIQRCTACDFAQPAALPSLPRFFDRMYDQRWADDWIANEHEDDYKDLIFTDILHGLARRAARSGRLLDIGAHAGRFVRLARGEGWDSHGLELNPKTAAFAARLSNGVVHQGDVRTFQPDGCYDAVTLIDVLEHIPSPLDVLSRVRTFLREGGWVAIKVPNGPAQRLKENLRARLTPGYRATLADNLVHVNHFSATSLVRALERTGFHEVTVVAAAPELPDAFGSRLLRLGAFRLARALPGGVASPLAFNLQAYGRRD